MQKNHFYIPAILMEMTPMVRGALPWEKKKSASGQNYFLRKRPLPHNILKDVHLSIYEHIDPNNSVFAPIHTTFEFHDGTILHFYYEGKDAAGKDLTFKLLDARPKQGPQQEALSRGEIQARIEKYQELSSSEIDVFFVEFESIKKSKIAKNEQELVYLLSLINQDTYASRAGADPKTHFLNKFQEHISFCSAFYSQKQLDILKNYCTTIYARPLSQMTGKSSTALPTSNTRPPSPTQPPPTSPTNSLFSSTSASSSSSSSMVINSTTNPQPINALSEGTLEEQLNGLLWSSTNNNWVKTQEQFEDLQKKCLDSGTLNDFFSLKKWLSGPYLETILHKKYFQGLWWLKEHVDLFDHAQKIFDALLDDPKQLDLIFKVFDPNTKRIRLSWNNKEKLHPLAYFFEKDLQNLFSAWLDKQKDGHVFFEGRMLRYYSHIITAKKEPYLSLLSVAHERYLEELSIELKKLEEMFDQQNAWFASQGEFLGKAQAEERVEKLYSDVSDYIKTNRPKNWPNFNEASYPGIADTYINMTIIYVKTRDIFPQLRTSLRNPNTRVDTQERMKRTLLQKRLQNAAESLLKQVPALTKGPIAMPSDFHTLFLEYFPTIAMLLVDTPEKIPNT